MKTLKIDFAILSIISLIATYVENMSFVEIFKFSNKTWQVIDIICIMLFISCAILEKIQILIDKRNGNKQE